MFTLTSEFERPIHTKQSNFTCLISCDVPIQSSNVVAFQAMSPDLKSTAFLPSSHSLLSNSSSDRNALAWSATKGSPWSPAWVHCNIPALNVASKLASVYRTQKEQQWKFLERKQGIKDWFLAKAGLTWMENLKHLAFIGRGKTDLFANTEASLCLFELANQVSHNLIIRLRPLLTGSSS